jgi:hypothetical protein
MAFDSLRGSKPARSSKCAYCGKADKDGVVGVVIKDKDAKTVTSRQIGACEKCAITTYEAALAVMTPPEKATAYVGGGKFKR